MHIITEKGAIKSYESFLKAKQQAIISKIGVFKYGALVNAPYTEITSHGVLALQN